MQNNKIIFLPLILSLAACQPASQQIADKDKQSSAQTTESVGASLGSLASCKQYSGLPPQWMKSDTAGMIRVQGGAFEMGNNNGYPEEKSLINSRRQVDDFYMDVTEVTNAQFEQFVQATSYVTEAEKNNEAAVFVQPI